MWVLECHLIAAGLKVPGLDDGEIMALTKILWGKISDRHPSRVGELELDKV